MLVPSPRIAIYQVDTPQPEIQAVSLNEIAFPREDCPSGCSQFKRSVVVSI